MKHEHPKELYVLALAELCERFAFWGVGFMLVLYLTEAYQFENAKATHIYGLFSGCATFMPLIGGFVADRWNYQTPLFVGALVNACGCFLLATGLPSLLYPSLAIIAIGYGIFTPSILTILGFTYRAKPSLREAGFSIYYASINIGVFLALISLGYIAQEYSWRMAFLFAGLVQLVGVLPILLYRKRHADTMISIQEMQKNFHLDQKRPYTKEEKDRIVVVITLCLFSILFWIAYNQAYSSMSLFSKNYTNRLFGGWQLPPSWILSSEPFFLILLAPILARLYANLQRRHLDPSPSLKTSLSLFFISLCFLIMMGASVSIPAAALSASVSPLYPICAFFLMALGEMLLAPIGLSLVTQLSPRHLTAFLVGFWYLCVGIAFYIGGMMAGWMGQMNGLFNFFSLFVILTLLPAGLLLLLARKLSKMSHQVVHTPPPEGGL